MTFEMTWSETGNYANQRRAVQEAFAGHVVAIFINGGRSIATGTLVEWQARRFILTASHNFADSEPSKATFFTRGKGPLIETTAEQAHKTMALSYMQGNTLSVSRVLAESDEDHDDLAIFEVLNLTNIAPGASFYNLLDSPLTISNGATVMTMGYASASSYEFAPGVHGVIPAGDIASFSNSLNARNDLHSRYDSSRHFVVPYTRTEDNIKPHGFSGAGAWLSLQPQGLLWKPIPFLGGVVTRWHSQHNLIQITHINSVLELFRKISPATN
jgi:hypothetical protein